MSEYREPKAGVDAPRRWRVIGAVVVILSLLGAAGAEYALRKAPQLLGPPAQLRQQAILMKHATKPDKDVGFVLQPNQHRRMTTPDFTYVRTTDSRGFVNPEPWPQTADIVFLGDSLGIGEGVGLEGQFARLIAARLPERRIVNLALPGAGVERQYRIYRHVGAALKPHLVVACLYLASDLLNDAHFYAWLQDPQGMDFNRFRLSYQRRNDPRPAYHPMRLLERSRLYAWAQRLASFGFASAASERHRFRDGAEIFLDPRQLPFHTRPMNASDPQLTRLFSALARLREATAQDGANLLIALIPSKEELFGAAPAAGAPTAMTHARRRLQDEGYAVLDLYPPLRKYGQQSAPYFRQDIHLNAAGNQVVANAFLDWRRRRMATP